MVRPARLKGALLPSPYAVGSSSQTEYKTLQASPIRIEKLDLELLSPYEQTPLHVCKYEGLMSNKSRIKQVSKYLNLI